MLPCKDQSDKTHCPRSEEHWDEQSFDPFHEKYLPSPTFEGERSSHSRDHEQRCQSPLVHPVQCHTREIYGVGSVVVTLLRDFPSLFIIQTSHVRVHFVPVEIPKDSDSNVKRNQQSKQDDPKPINVVSSYFFLGFFHRFR